MSQLATTTNGHSQKGSVDTQAIAQAEMAKRDFKALAKISTVTLINQLLQEYGADKKEIKSSIISPEHQIIVLRIWQLIQEGKSITLACQEVKATVEQLSTEQKSDAIEKRVATPSESSAIDQKGQQQAQSFNSSMLAQMTIEAREAATRLEQLKFLLLGAARNSEAVQNDPRVQQAKEIAFNASPSNSILDDDVFNSMLAQGVNFFS